MQNMQNLQTKPNLPNQIYQIKPTKPTKPNLPNQTYQTKATKPNLPNQIELRLSSILNQTYQTKITGKSTQRLGLLCLWQCLKKYFYQINMYFIIAGTKNKSYCINVVSQSPLGMLLNTNFWGSLSNSVSWGTFFEKCLWKLLNFRSTLVALSVGRFDTGTLVRSQLFWG